MPCGEADDLAEELLVHLAEDVGGEDGELVGAFGIVEPLDDVFQRLVVDLDLGGEGVGFFVAVFLFLEVEQAGVVPVVGLGEELDEALIGIGPVLEGLEPAVFLDAPVLADAQEHDAVDRALDGEVQLARGKIGVPEGDVLGEHVAPVFDLGQEGVVNRCRAFLEPARLGVLVEGAFEHGFLGEDGDDLAPFLGIVFVGEVE